MLLKVKFPSTWYIWHANLNIFFTHRWLTFMKHQWCAKIYIHIMCVWYKNWLLLTNIFPVWYSFISKMSILPTFDLLVASLLQVKRSLLVNRRACIGSGHWQTASSGTAQGASDFSLRRQWCWKPWCKRKMSLPLVISNFFQSLQNFWMIFQWRYSWLLQQPWLSLVVRHWLTSYLSERLPIQAA